MTSLGAATRQLLARLALEEVPAGVDAEFVVAPPTVADAAEVLAAAAEHGMRVGFLGAGSQLGIGGRLTPDLVLSSAAMRQVVDWQAEDLTIVVEPGMPVTELETMLAERGQTAVLPEHSAGATVGGTVATGTSGYRRLRYGPTRDRVLEVTLATGYGKVVRAGGRVVKNVTGYDLPRLVAGSLGALGFIGPVCLKLWPLPPATVTVTVADPARAGRAAYRPLAVVEADGEGFVYLGGTAEQVEAQAAELGGESRPGLHWPAPVEGVLRCSLRVPARHLEEAVDRIRAWEPAPSYRALHGVGEVLLGSEGVAVATFLATRRWAEEQGGALVVLDGPGEFMTEVDPWGAPPPTIELQRRVKTAFDPAGVCNPGKLPGGL